MANWKIRYRPEAAAEIDEADDWLRGHDEKAAANWREATRTTIERIADSPRLWAADQTGIREVLVRNYRYKVIYRLFGDIIEIVAVAHTSRRPRYWQKRLRK
jgi:toxin ParE1/3/4